MTAPNIKRLDSQIIELGEPWLPVHNQALVAVNTRDAKTLRILSAANLDDVFLSTRLHGVNLQATAYSNDKSIQIGLRSR